MMKFARWVDGLSKSPLILAWVGQSLAAVLVIMMVGALTATATFGWTQGGRFVIIMACAGFLGSVFRNRNHRQPQSLPVTRYTKQRQ